MRPGADLSIDAIALLVAEFLERLDLHDVTLIMNDWGGPQLLVDHGRTERTGGRTPLGGVALAKHSLPSAPIQQRYVPTPCSRSSW
jgi:pimeloyl-ACP methyl ester carboxylesterase